jgi:rod shape-determining protein MreC
VVVDRAGDASYLVHTKASIFKQNENLLNENKDLRLKMVDYEILKTENSELKEMFNRGIVAKDFILANILTKPNYSPYDTLIIDIGSNVQIKVNDKVYSNAVIPIGEVTAVYDDTALVTLYSNPGNVTAAMLDGTNTSIELVGRGGGNFETTIPTDLQFVKGGIVYLPDISTEVVAIIEDVISRPTDPAKKLLLSSPVNVQNIKWVFVKK